MSLTDEVTDLNIAYVLLAQKMLRHDRATGMLRLGIGHQLAEFVMGLSVGEILNLSSSNVLLCSLRHGDVMPGIMNAGHASPVQQAHLFIVLASRLAHQLEIAK